jgi:dephospho-CoA kinase
MTKHHVPRLGITGGIGSGKSTALAFLRELGAAVVSTDDIVHRLLSDPAIAARVIEHFGEDIVDGDRLNRPALARIVFDDERERVWLESLLHPLVKKAVDEWARAQERAAALRDGHGIGLRPCAAGDRPGADAPQATRRQAH